METIFNYQDWVYRWKYRPVVLVTADERFTLGFEPTSESLLGFQDPEFYKLARFIAIPQRLLFNFDRKLYEATRKFLRRHKKQLRLFTNLRKIYFHPLEAKVTFPELYEFIRTNSNYFPPWNHESIFEEVFGIVGPSTLKRISPEINFDSPEQKFLYQPYIVPKIARYSEVDALVLLMTELPAKYDAFIEFDVSDLRWLYSRTFISETVAKDIGLNQDMMLSYGSQKTYIHLPSIASFEKFCSTFMKLQEIKPPSFDPLSMVIRSSLVQKTLRKDFKLRLSIMLKQQTYPWISDFLREGQSIEEVISWDQISWN